MKRFLPTVLASLGLLLAAGEAFGFAHGQFYVGSRSANFEGGEQLSGDVRSSEAGFSVLFDYFPENWPVAAGLTGGSRDYRFVGADQQLDRMWQWYLGPELTAWVPLDLWVNWLKLKPYAKYGATYGAYTARHGSGDDGGRAWYSSFGRHFSYGLKWDSEPLFAPLIEVQTNKEELDGEGSNVDGVETDSSVVFKSKAILIGFEASM